MSEIRTRQKRRRRCESGGVIEIEETYIDQPATLYTWIDNITALAAETGIHPLRVHQMLFRQLPEVFGGLRRPWEDRR